MPTPTPADVAAHLGLPQGSDLSDPRLVNATNAGIAWAQARRSLTPYPGLFELLDVWQGCVLYAALVYQARSTPSGIPGPEAYLGGMSDTSAAYWRACELVGSDPVTA